MLDLFWLIPILPFVGFLINGIGIKWVPRQLAGVIACGAVGLSFVIAVGAFLGLRALPVDERSLTHSLFPWISVGSFHVNVAFQWDQLSAVMALVVTGVGFLIHVYSVGYMAHDPGYKRYFTYLNLFTFSMLVLVLADNFLLLFVGWEGVGLCSYLLIGFWYHKDSASDAGKKAFIVNRIGDFGVLLGMFLVFWNTGSLTFNEVFHRAPELMVVGAALPTAITLLFFLGATGKSAQIPLFVWLPDAMEGPTPVSALIHAATMVTAGVYLFARASSLFMLAPGAMVIVAVIGALTAIMAATIGLVQTDIKRVLAYSTVSQLGYMFLAVGSGAFVAAIFHLMTHAFFKALLFLGSGSVIEACHHEQDMNKMGGLGKKLPITKWTFIIGSLALAGVPIFAGFFSKDEILYEAFTSQILGGWGKVLWVLGAAAALMTAFYIIRAVALTFYGQPRDKKIYEHAKESPAVMTVPLMILAVASAVGGFLGIPIWKQYNLMHNWLSPVVGAHGAEGGHGTEAAGGAVAGHGEVAAHGGSHLALELILMGASVALALLGIFLAYRVYIQRPARAKELGARFKGFYRVLWNKYYVDEFYGMVIIKPFVDFSRFLWKVIDVQFVDGLVNGVAWVMRTFGTTLRPIQTGLTPNYATAILVGAIAIMSYVLLGRIPLMPILSLVTFLPLLGALLIWLVPMDSRGHRGVALLTAVLTFAVSLQLWFGFERGTPAFQFEEVHAWIPAFGVSYHLGVDGISVLLVLLSTFLGIIGVLASFSAITDKTRGYYAFLLVLQTGMTGVFVSLDLFLFYVFWEAMLIPMYFLIGVWGGERRLYAAVKFFIYTMFGSLLMLVALVYLAVVHSKQTGTLSFDLMSIYAIELTRVEQLWLFGAYALAFAIKVPLFPFHTWLPDAHVEAPTAGSIILAGVLLKMGTYGFVRFCLPLFPEATVAAVPVIAALSIIGIIYGAMVAMVQPDLKKLVAYSSVSHLGFVMLGVFALNLQGLQGGMLQMINHGISTGALFLLVGMIYERRHTRLIEKFGGLTKVMPAFAVCFLIMTLSSIGLPGTNGFVGEFLILLGAFGANKVYGVLAATGVILAAVYMLWMYQRVMFGVIKHKENEDLKDMNFREWITVLPLLALVFWIGIYPKPFLDTMDASLNNLLDQVGVEAPVIGPGDGGPDADEPEDEHSELMRQLELMNDDAAPYPALEADTAAEETE